MSSRSTIVHSPPSCLKPLSPSSLVLMLFSTLFTGSLYFSLRRQSLGTSLVLFFQRINQANQRRVFNYVNFDLQNKNLLRGIRLLQSLALFRGLQTVFIAQIEKGAEPFELTLVISVISATFSNHEYDKISKGCSFFVSCGRPT